MKSKLFTAVFILFASTLILVATSGFKPSQGKPWPVPDKNAKMANPVKSSAETIKAGKELWVKHCQSCHGKIGKGDGTKSATLKTEPGDFSSAAFQKQSDGSIFYKTMEGREDMPSFKKKIPDADDIWSLVNYIRTLKK